MGFSITSAVMGGIIIICYSIVIANARRYKYYDYRYGGKYVYDTKMAISIIILVLGIAEFVIGIWAAMLLYDESLHVLCTTTGKLASNTSIPTYLGGRDGTVVRELASHQCGPGSTPGPGVICGYSGFPLSSKTNTSKFQFNLGGKPN